MDRRLRTDRRPEVYKGEFGVIRLDNNPRNSKFFVRGFVGEGNLKGAVAYHYDSGRVRQSLFSVLDRSASRIKGVFEDGDRWVVSNGRIAKAENLNNDLRTALDSDKLILDTSGYFTEEWGISLPDRLKGSHKRLIALVAPKLIDELSYRVVPGNNPLLRLHMNGFDHPHDLYRLVKILAGAVNADFKLLPDSVQKPFKTDVVVVQQLCGLIERREYISLAQIAEVPTLAQEEVAARWTIPQLFQALWSRRPWRGLDRS